MTGLDEIKGKFELPPVSQVVMVVRDVVRRGKTRKRQGDGGLY